MLRPYFSSFAKSTKSVITSLLLLCSLSSAAQDYSADNHWKGQWIGLDRLLPGEDLTNKTRVNARYLRTTISLDNKEIKKAEAVIAVVGYYELYVNGQHIDNGVLKPQQTDIRKSVMSSISVPCWMKESAMVFTLPEA